MESMRAVGYTLEAAIADLIDNSVTANASRVDILFSAEPDDYIAIVDDGRGMTEDQAREAMRLAGKSTTSERAAHDLGRFGLGLKTASLSQCRDMVIVSKSEAAEVCGFRWDLDHLARLGTWSLIRLDDSEFSSLPHWNDLAGRASGTMVLWRRLDQLRAQSGPGAAALDAAVMGIKSHLALVFHRFLAGEHGRPFAILVNGTPLQQIDPFLSSHPATQRSAPEAFDVAGDRIQLQAFTLPLISKLTAGDRQKAQVAGRLRDSQGFYIYRAMRLVIWGTWFRILPRDELGKLARVRVDIPNTLDHLWALDIKKSAALPPPEVRSRLRRVAERIVQPSKRVHLYRGRPEPSADQITHVWQLVRNGNEFRYEVNRDHPLVLRLAAQLDPELLKSVSALLALVETNFPSQDLFNRLGQDEMQEAPKPDLHFIEELAVQLWETYRGHRDDPEAFVNAMAVTEPFTQCTDPRAMLKEAIKQS